MSEPSSAIVVRIGLPPALERVRRKLDLAAEMLAEGVDGRWRLHWRLSLADQAD